MKLARLLASLAVAVSVMVGVAACAPAVQPVQLAAGTVVIDVRTADEFAAGHLDGAINIDVEAPTFDELASQLPADGVYVLYCRSGNRAASAMQRLEGLGFTTMTNAGGIDAASASTGLPIVR